MGNARYRFLRRQRVEFHERGTEIADQVCSENWCALPNILAADSVMAGDHSATASPTGLRQPESAPESATAKNQQSAVLLHVFSERAAGARQKYAVVGRQCSHEGAGEVRSPGMEQDV